MLKGGGAIRNPNKSRLYTSIVALGKPLKGVQFRKQKMIVYRSGLTSAMYI